MRDSAKVLPCSSVISLAMSSTRSRTSTAVRISTAARSCGDFRRHRSKADAAAAKASSRSCVLARGTSASTWPVAGLRTSAATPWPPARHWPAMYCLTVG